MVAEDRLAFRLKSQPGYVDGSSFQNANLAQVPRDTIFLSLENSAVTDEGVRSLPDLTALRCLDLDSTAITDAAFQKVSTFINLEELWIEDTAVTDACIRYLSALHKLRFVSIIDCAISDRAILELQQYIPDLEIHR